MSDTVTDTDDREGECAWVAACPRCGLRAEVSADDPNEAIRLYRRHASVTGHDIEWERIAGAAAETDAGDVAAVLRALADRYEAGVPVGALTAAMADREMSIAETLDAVYDLRMSGKLYEPRDDHLLPV